jgi:FkbM family methyltransferase
MIVHQGIYLPDGEEHFVEWMTKNGETVDGKGTYQIKKLRAAMGHVRQFRTAVDIGGHVGLWSMHLAKKFQRVEAFEPVAAHRECFLQNLPAAAEGEGQSVFLHPYAIGDHADNVFIRSNPISSGDSRVDGAGEIPMRTLDSFNLQDVDFIKIDTEGYELFAVRGAEETVKRCRPTMVVEQKGHGMKFHGFRKEEAAELLESWGMKRVANMSGDIIMVPA